jgi:hypothetical protein
MPEAWLRIRKTTTSSGVPYIFAAAEGRQVFWTPSHARLHDDDRKTTYLGLTKDEQVSLQLLIQSPAEKEIVFTSFDTD